MILVTGATGQVGRAVIGQLAGTTPVRALVRDRAAAADLGSVEIACGSFEDAASLSRALDAVETVFLAGPRQPRAGGAAHPRDPRREAAGVRHVVKLSALGASPDSPVALMRGA